MGAYWHGVAGFCGNQLAGVNCLGSARHSGEPVRESPFPHRSVYPFYFNHTLSDTLKSLWLSNLRRAEILLAEIIKLHTSAADGRFVRAGVVRGFDAVCVERDRNKSFRQI